MREPRPRPPPRRGPEVLLVLARCEDFAAWLFERTPQWPKRARLSLTQRIENAVLELLDELVLARYEREGRRQRLEAINLRLERLRHLFRLARRAQVCPSGVHETSVRSLDEIGRLLSGWRRRLASGSSSAEADAPAAREERP